METDNACLPLMRTENRMLERGNVCVCVRVCMQETLGFHLHLATLENLCLCDGPRHSRLFIQAVSVLVIYPAGLLDEGSFGSHSFYAGKVVKNVLERADTVQCCVCITDLRSHGMGMSMCIEVSAKDRHTER